MHKNIFTKIIKHILPIVVFVLFYIAVPTVASASVGDNIFGNAWSNNIGWVSFNNCENPGLSSTCGTIGYGVKTTAQGVVSGYAWNDNVGWISFNPADWGSCPPSGSCTSVSSYTNNWSSGWARVLSMKIAGTNNGGADGWIHLSNSSPAYGASIGSTNVASSLGNLFSGSGTIIHSTTGYWWGSKVVGWIDLNPAGSISLDSGGVFDCISCSTPPVGPTVTLTPSNTSVLSGNTASFTWSTSPSTFIPVKCEGLGGVPNNTDWNAVNFGTATSASGINVKLAPTSVLMTSFALKCTDVNNITATSSYASISTIPLTPYMTYGGACRQTGGGSPSIDWNVNDPTPTCRVEATPAGGTTYYYPSSGAYTLTGNTSGAGASGAFVDTNFTNVSTTYKLSCTNGSGANLSSRVSSPGASVSMCSPNYGISVAPSCAALVKSGSGKTAKYTADATMTVTPLNGFISMIDAYASATVGTASITPSNFTLTNGLYNTIVAHISLSEAAYNAIVASKITPINPIPTNNLISSINVITSGVAQNTSIKSTTIDFCAAGSVVPYISATPTSQNMLDTNTTTTINVDSNVSWTATVSYPSGTTPWITSINPISSANLGVINVSFSTNLTSSSRTAYIKITDDNDVTIFDTATIRQDGALCTDTIVLSSILENVNDTSGTISTVSVTTNVPSWTEISSDSWLQTNSSPSSFTPTYDQNFGKTSRTATINITAGCANAVYTVNQLGTNPEIHITPKTQTAFTSIFTGDTPPFNVSSNVKWTLTLDDNWADDPGISAMYGNFSFPIHINSPNILPLSRDVHIKVTDDNDPANFDTATITQNALCFGIGCGDYVNISSGSVIPALNTSATLVISSNTDWQVSVTYPGISWINTITPLIGNGNSSLSLSFGQNNTTSPIIADIKVTDIHDSSIFANTTIMQDGINLNNSVSVNPSTISCVSDLAGSRNVNVNTTGSWTASSNQGWLTVNNGSGYGSMPMNISWIQNPGASPRVGQIAVTDNISNTAILNITQNDSGTICTVVAPPTFRPKYKPF